MHPPSTLRARSSGITSIATDNSHGFLYSGGTYTTVDHPSATGTQLLGINASGQIVGYYVDNNGNYQSFLDSGGTFTTLAAPSAPGGTWAYGINDQGQIVGYIGNSSYGFLYSGGTYTILDVAGAGTTALGINNAGQIVGSYVQSYVNGFGKVNFKTHGFFANPSTPPNPPPPVGTTADMILHSIGGLYEIYNVGNNSVLAAYSLAQVGTEWQAAGFGNFNGSDTTDMLLRNSSTGGFEVYDIANNNITNATFLGTVGWIGRSWASAIFQAAARPT
jgi:uncharacterized membrane protein